MVLPAGRPELSERCSQAFSPPPSPPARPSRRRFLGAVAGACGAAALAGVAPACFSSRSRAKIKLGLMLPYSGVYGALGQNIADALKLALDEAGGKLGGREIEIASVDDESDPAKAASNTNKVVVGEKVDFLIGTVHSGVALGMIKIVREEGVLTLIPNAGLKAATRELCAPNIFRTSTSNWQPSYPLGKVVLDDGHRRVALMYWKYSAGIEAITGAKESLLAGGGVVEKELSLDFPSVEFQAHLTEIAALKPDAVLAIFAGSGAAKFVKDYEAAGLKGKIPLYGTGYLTEGVLAAQGAAAEGIKTTLHYADALDLPQNHRFREAFKKLTGRPADVYAVQGYDTGKLLIQALGKVQGDVKAQKELVLAMEAAEIDSPRGAWTMSKAHNPIQNIYLREVQGGKEIVLRVAHKALADPATGCEMP
jgi:branched-chain amino acid transport system substrate-binding protein